MSKEQILSSDGIPLELSLKKAERKNKLKALFLVGPLLLFILITFVFPIGDMLFRSVDDRMITKMLPNTFTALKMGWKELPMKSLQRFYDDLFIKSYKNFGKIIAD
jgi:putative spermidine/putrescine transport system permease protein